MTTEYVKIARNLFDVVVDGQSVGQIRKYRTNPGAYSAARYAWVVVVDGKEGKFQHSTRSEATKALISK